MDFARTFVRAHDEVEREYYDDVARRHGGHQLRRLYQTSLFKPLLGKAMSGPVEFYETQGRLMRHTWLSLSFGVYDSGHLGLPDPATRLHSAQVNTVDLAWRPALETAPAGGLSVDVGTGRGNSVARLALANPRTRVVSITISPEQAEIAGRIVARLGVADRVEIRIADILDPKATADLAGQADGVTAIEVAGHFPEHRTTHGFAAMASMLKPGAPLTLMDPVLKGPPTLVHTFFNQFTWSFRPASAYLHALRAAGLTDVNMTDLTTAYRPTWRDSGAVVRARWDRIRAEFGPVLTHAFHWMRKFEARPLGAQCTTRG